MSTGDASDRIFGFSLNSFRRRVQRLMCLSRVRDARSVRRQSWIVGTGAAVGETLEARSLLSALSVAIVPGSISENGGSAVGTVTRSGGSFSLPLTVNLSSSDSSEATVPGSVVIQAGQASADFEITGVDDSLLDGTQSAVITATAVGSGDGTLDTHHSDSE